MPDMSNTPTPQTPKRRIRSKASAQPDPVAAAQETISISPTLLAALVTRSVAKAFEPILAELQDIARTSHDTSDRLFGEELKAQAEKKQAEAIFENVFGYPMPRTALAAEQMAATLFGKSGAEAAQEAKAAQKRTEANGTQRLQGLMDKLWMLGYRPTNEQPLTCRSFHEFEALIGR